MKVFQKTGFPEDSSDFVPPSLRIAIDLRVRRVLFFLCDYPRQTFI
jgi:hypothetical protein